MARVRKHRSKWQVLFRDPSTHKERSAGVFARKSDALTTKANVERDLVLGEWLDPDRADITFGSWARRSTATWVDLSSKTKADYDSLLRTWLLPTFGGTPLNRITAIDVREWLAGILNARLSPRRAGKALMLLRKILRMAVDDRRLRYNPAASVKAPRVARRERPWLLPAQVALVAEAVPDRLRSFVLVMGVAGLRFGEAAGLRSGDVDVLRGEIYVRQSVSESHLVGLGGRVEVKSPKSGEARTVRVPRFLADALNDHLLANPSTDPEALLFAATNGAPPRATNFSTQVFKPALQAVGLDRAVTAHDLRHSAAAAMIAVNPNPEVIKRQLGHASVKTTFDNYGHLFPDESEKLASGLDRQWEQAVRGPDADQEGSYATAQDLAGT